MPENNQNRFEFVLTNLQMINQTLFNQAYVIVSNKKTGKFWQSSNFYQKMFQIWKISIDCSKIQLQLFIKIKKSYQKVCQVQLSQGADTIYLKQYKNPTNNICVLRYELRQLNKSQIYKIKSNHFSHNQNIFDSVGNDFQIQQEKLDDERVGFYGDISVASIQSNINDRIKIQIEPKMYENKITTTQKQNSDDERKMFTKLDDSGSFIKEFLNHYQQNKLKKAPTSDLINQSNEKDQELSKIKQSICESDEEYMNTAQKWYKKKFSKQNLRTKKRNNSLLKNNEVQPIFNSKNIKIKQFNTTKLLENQVVIKQLTDMSVQQNVKLKSIQFSLVSQYGGERQKLYQISRSDGEQSSLWYTTISLPNKGQISVQCQTQEGELNGCLGSNQFKKGECFLYDIQGNSVCKFGFKFKLICNYVVQTQQILPPEIIDSDLKDKIKVSLSRGQNNFQKQNKQFQNHQQAIKSQSKIKENINILIKQQNILKNQIQEQKNQLLQNNVRQETKLNTDLIVQEFKQYQLQNDLQMYSKTFQHRDNQKAPNQIDIINQQENKKNQLQQLQMEISKDKDVKSSILNNKQEKGDQKLLIFKNARRKKSFIGSRLRKHSEIDVQIDKQDQNSVTLTKKLQYPINNSQVQQFLLQGKINLKNSLLLDKNENQIQKKLYQSNFIEKSEYFLSNQYDCFNKDDEHKNFRYGRMLTEQIKIQNLNQTKLYSSVTIDQNKIDFKIQSVMLTLNRKSYTSKIIKMQIQNHKYFTQTSKSLYISKWSGKGYFFPNITKYAILYISLIEETQADYKITGRSTINLALLPFNKSNQELFYEDFLRNQKQEQIGKIIINYRTISKNLKKIECKQLTQKIQTKMENMCNGNHSSMKQQLETKPKSPSKKMTRISTEGSSRLKESKTIFQRRRYVSYQRKDISLSFLSRHNKISNNIRIFRGGNIFIPKATRFDQNKNKRMKKIEPGPGSYKLGSMFDKYATPF